MTWLTEIWADLYHWMLPILLLLHFLIFWATIVWILMTKTESTSAVAWCLIVILVPYLGALHLRAVRLAARASAAQAKAQAAGAVSRLGQAERRGTGRPASRPTCIRCSAWPIASAPIP